MTPDFRIPPAKSAPDNAFSSIVPDKSMMRLEDLHPNTAVRGVLSDQIVTVINVQWFGSLALELTYKAPSGRCCQRTALSA